jgi:hypothetical protein
MDGFKKKYLTKEYDKIGPLDMDDFVALKTLNKQVFSISETNLDMLTLRNLHKGDTIKITGIFKNILGGGAKRGTVAVDNISSIDIDQRTSQVIIENDKYCFVQNGEPSMQIEALKVLLQNPEYGLTREAIEDVLPNEISWGDFQEVRDEIEQSREHEQNLDLDLSQDLMF